MTKRDIILDGQHLTVSDLKAITQGEDIQVLLDKKALRKVRESFSFVQKNITEKIVYGINTGFGPMASHLLGKNQLDQLQYNLIRSHAVGMGNPIPKEYVLSAMVTRLNTLVKGYSGVSEDLLEHYASLINRRIIPIIPEHGAVGTSGDLVQLAHIALAIIGEGEVWYQGKIQKTSLVYKKLGISAYKLKPKEGLSLINGTAVMSGISSLLITQAEHLVELAIQLGALSLEIVRAYSDSLDPLLHNVRPHAGQIHVAKHIRELLASSHMLKNRMYDTSSMHIDNDIQELPEAIQEVYSLRCMAQILGPIYDTLQKAKQDISVEINSTTDNPIVDIEGKQFLHGGNFHGDYVAVAIDQLKIAMVKMTMLSERRTNFFLHQKINKRYPHFMNLDTPGLTLGLQGLQFVGTSTTAHSQSLAFPHHIHSIPTNGDNQDVVSMGTDAALIASKVVDNAYIVLTIELLTLCQAVDYLKAELLLSKPTRNLYQFVRAHFPAVTKDRVLTSDLPRLLELVKSKLTLTP